MALGASLIFKSLVLNQSCNCTSMDTGQSTIWTDCLTPSLLRYQFILLWLGDIGNRMWETFLRFLCSIDWTWNWSQYALQYPLSCATVPVLLCTGQILRFSADVKCCHNELLHFACERYWCCVTWKCVHVCVCVYVRKFHINWLHVSWIRPMNWRRSYQKAMSPFSKLQIWACWGMIRVDTKFEQG